MYYILGFVLLLGVLVFIHEFGHFIVAKAFKVRVETFSIGMGKKIFGFKRGETDYALSLLPLGGFVKLTGQDPREVVPPELEDRSFRNKPLYARAAVVLAGPLFNAVLAILVFTFLYMGGVPSQGAVIERLLAGSPAELAGFRMGDRILEIQSPQRGSVKILDLSDLERVVGESVGEDLTFVVQHKNSTETTKIKYSPVLGQDRDSTIGVVKDRGILRGVERSAPAPVTMILPHSWAETRAIRGPVWISEVSYEKNGKTESIKTENFFELQNAWKTAVEAQGESGKVSILTYPVSFESPDPKANAKSKVGVEEEKETPYILAWTNAKDRPSPDLANNGFMSSELILTEVRPDSPAEKLGLKKGDILSTLNGEKIQSFNSFRENLQATATQGKAIQLGWIRDGVAQSSEIKPELVSQADPLTEVKKNQFQIGAVFMALPAPPTMVTVKAENIFEAFVMGVDRSYRLTVSMLDSFYRLARGDISPKTLGGPILIAKISGESLKQGAIPFFKMMAFISLNLFLLNLFPIPVLDGGHLVMYMIEAIRRKPLSIKFIEMWSTAGFALLMGLVAFVMFNDLHRLFIKS